MNKAICVIVISALAVLATLSFRVSPAASGAAPPIALKREADPNKVAARLALKAESAASFNDARYVLGPVKIDDLTDDDVKQLVIFQRRLCTFCIEAGIPRDVNQSVKDILKSVNYRALVAAALKNGVGNVPDEVKRLFNEATALHAGLDGYNDLKLLVAKRYALSRE